MRVDFCNSNWNGIPNSLDVEVAQIGEAAWEVGKGGSCANIQEILAQILIDIDNGQVRELDLRVTLNSNFSFIYIYILFYTVHVWG